MKTYFVESKSYRLPNTLSDFQLKMYVHLINWKWKNLTEKPGYFRDIPYDAILPDNLKDQLFPLYPPIKEIFQDHQKKFPFKSHEFIGHMASSQAACANLFLPILKDPSLAAMILNKVKPDLKKIATEYLDKGFRIEFWDEHHNMLNDHNQATGTDADIAIAYYDHESKLNLWLIEHKLTEAEFTTCGANKSKGRTSMYSCIPVTAIIDSPDICYYHSGRHYQYWNITLNNKSPINLDVLRQYEECPFKGGLNQLWRNILLGSCIESSVSTQWPYKKVYFSVVYHPYNHSLHSSISEFQKLLKFPDRFSAFSSDELINSANEIKEKAISEWVCWYKKLYYY